MNSLFRSQLFIVVLCIFTSIFTSAHSKDALKFDDAPLADALDLPEWFNLSFLDLNDSLEDAIKEGKQGIIIYFGRKDCPYCKALLEGNWGDPVIAKYTQEHFNVIAIDVRGARTVTDFNGRKWTEKTYSSRRRMNFTPTLLFYSTRGQLALKLPGFRPKYQFRAALEYVADSHYLRESYRNYLSRAESALSFGLEELNENDMFLQPPYDLSSQVNNKPLLVSFEHTKCHACDVLHGDTLSEPEVIKQLHKLNVVQLNTKENTPVITPDGKKTTADQWAKDLNLTFAPSLLFFDTNGKEILRIESVVRFYRLNNVLKYISEKQYLKYPTFQNWLQDYRNSKKFKNSETL